MKKASWIIVILALVLAAILIADVKKEKNESKKENEEITEIVDESKLFEQPRVEAELCYLSAFGNDGYDSYIYAFENKVVNAVAKENGVDYDTFVADVIKTLESNIEITVALYGEDFEVGYKLQQDEKIEGAAFDALKAELAQYGVDTSLVKEAVKGYYTYILFNYGEKAVNEVGTPEYYFGEVPENAEILYSSSFDLTLYYVDNGEDGGWFVSPEYF